MDQLLVLARGHQGKGNTEMSKIILNTTIERDAEKIRVLFSSEEHIPCRTIPIEMVLDLDRFGDVVGIEIINLKLFGGQSKFPVTDQALGSSVIEFSYDEDTDSAYFYFKHDKSLDQRAVDGWLEIGESGCLIGVTAKLN